MKLSTYCTLILSTALLASCSVENPSSTQNHVASEPSNPVGPLGSTEPDSSSTDSDAWTFITQADKMNDTTKRRLQSTSIGGAREYELTAYCDDFRMGLTLAPTNFDINEINWRYGLPGFSAEFIKVGMKAGNSNASTYALKGESDIHILLNSREMKDLSIILDRPNTLAQIASDAEFKRITKSLFEYLKGTFEGNKLLFNGVFPDEVIEFSPPNQSADVSEFLNSCNTRIQQLYPTSDHTATVETDSKETEDAASASNISAYDASFPCENASTSLEKAICSEQELAELDNFVARQYEYAVEAYPDVDIKGMQKAWFNDIRSQCEDTACLKRVYQERSNFYGEQYPPGE